MAAFLALSRQEDEAVSGPPSRGLGLVVVLGAVFFVSLEGVPARACSVCGCGDPLVPAGDALARGHPVRAAVETEYLTAEARSDGDPSERESIAQSTLRPLLSMSPIETLNLVLQAPVVRKDWMLADAGGNSIGSRLALGLGDVDLGARWFLVDRTDLATMDRRNLGISLGTSFPTGEDDARVGGERIDDHAQLGSGAFAPYVGGIYADHEDPWNFFASATGRVRTANRFGYRYGSSALWSLHGEIHPWDRGAFQLGIDGRYADHDRSAGRVMRNTGGTVVSLTPGILFEGIPDTWFEARLQVPVYTRLFGDQSVGPTYVAALRYEF